MHMQLYLTQLIARDCFPSHLNWRRGISKSQSFTEIYVISCYNVAKFRTPVHANQSSR
ncbi:hypothetical protein BABINDRAFT_162036 [Babjeviella inositovora NRRL Y-12698]|uniref:Uncharacterized protein n=1 Tax=Babjeviella inositovora NRRL Y-12698 TaxID=984486 RepID=A0A1E3QNC6_9ASCO|nr:uncharacterized protein BABINDRAFT_162036 [Babjeviella inositovora NRRL Y-12698]ODQ78944.1 hypothetical protein BABINDRAFT_162036 [Babjeviella inositovora NRRL Y-12698]